MPDKLLNINNGIPKSVLDQIDLQEYDVIQGKKYIGSDGTLHTGTLEDRPNDVQCPVVTQYDPGTGFVYLALPAGAYRRTDGRMSPHPNMKRRLMEIVGEAGFDRGAWSTTINPGGAVAIPQGWHNGSGVVRANPATYNGYSMVELRAESRGNEYVSGNSTAYASGTIKWCPTGRVAYSPDDSSVYIEVTGYSGNAINYRWSAHNFGIRFNLVVIV